MPIQAAVPTFDLMTVPEKDRGRVADLIPDPELAEQYVHRHIEGVYDFDYLDGAIEDQDNILLVGPTGSAKSTLFRAYAASRGLPYTVIEANASMDLSTVLGRLDPQMLSWVDGEFTLVARYGGVAVIEEINMVHPRVSAGFHQLLAVTRRMSLPENTETIRGGRGGLGDPQPLLLAGNMNPLREYQGTVRMNYALMNRFGMPHKWPYLHEVETVLLSSVRLLDVAENIRTLDEIRTPVSTNMLMELESHYYRYGWNPAARMFVNHFEGDEEAPVMRALEANSAAICAELDKAAEGSD